MAGEQEQDRRPCKGPRQAIYHLRQQMTRGDAHHEKSLHSRIEQQLSLLRSFEHPAGPRRLRCREMGYQDCGDARQQ